MDTNIIYNEDCMQTIRKINDKSIDLIVTDPPYLMNYKTGHRKDKSHDFCYAIQNDNNEDLIKQYIKECYRILKDNSSMYMFCNSNRIDFFKREAEKYFKLNNIIVWVKNNHTAGDLSHAFGKKYEFILLLSKGKRKFNGKRLTDVWEFNRIVGNKQTHQNEKPIDLIMQCINCHSNKNDIIFDGFMGSGTTAAACIKTGRRFIGSEIEKKYYDLCLKRIGKENQEKRQNLF